MDCPRSRRVALRLMSNDPAPNKPVAGREAAARQLAAERERAVSAIRKLAQIAVSREERLWVAYVELVMAEIDEALTSTMHSHYARFERDGDDGNGSALRSVEPPR